MNSPVNKTGSTTPVKTIKTATLIKGYASSFNIDVTKYFAGADDIAVYRCNDTGYHFYHPFTTAGDSDFYRHFQQFSWYYLPWKWEHETCAGLIQTGYKVLEVGCGTGAFLKKISSQKNIQCHGLELNESCVLNSPGLIIENSLIEAYSQQHANAFDLVCSFQVLEHIGEVHSFIKGQVACIKQGGKLVISVPNNDSIIMKSDEDLLNMPPHHMGLWNEQALRSLEKYFDIKLQQIYFEPLQPYHYEWYTTLQLRKIAGRAVAQKLVKLSKLLKLDTFINRRLQNKAAQIKGHTILAVYQKL